MPGRPAARITDLTSHLGSPLLPGIGSMNVHIGNLPAWRGIPAAAAGALQIAKAGSHARVTAAEAATLAAAGTPGAPAAAATEATVKATELAAMSSQMMSSSAGADTHTCPLHGPGVVIDGSRTVLINNLPACRMQDTVLEALGPPNKIVGGHMSVLIGG